MLLAVDSATRKIGVALYDGVEVCHEAFWHSANHHSVELSPAIQSALERVGLAVDDLEAVALAIGPGSYTGLRIGAAVVKGLAFAQHIPVIGVSTFDILVSSQPVVPETQLAAILQAGRGRLAVGWYQVEEDRWVFSGNENLYTPEELSKKIKSPTYVCGELDESLRKLLGRKRKNVILASPAQSVRRPSYLAEIAWQRLQAGEVDDPASLAPHYLQTGDHIPA